MLKHSSARWSFARLGASPTRATFSTLRECNLSEPVDSLWECRIGTLICANTSSKSTNHKDASTPPLSKFVMRTGTVRLELAEGLAWESRNCCESLSRRSVGRYSRRSGSKWSQICSGIASSGGWRNLKVFGAPRGIQRRRSCQCFWSWYVDWRLSGQMRPRKGTRLSQISWSRVAEWPQPD